jgi:undecaprenyl-diphosphatase
LRTDRQIDPMISERGQSDWQAFEMSRGIGCKGMPVTLIAR